jgi:periplasmic protein CpxP/Spy
MNNLNNNRNLWLAIFGLLILNLCTLGWVILSKNGKRPIVGNFFIEDELKFNNNQKESFKMLKDKHFEEVLPLRDSIKTLKKEVFELIKADKFDRIAFDSKMIQISDKIHRNEANTMLHFREIRDMCSPEQKVLFDEELIAKLSSPPGGGGGNRPPPPPPR